MKRVLDRVVADVQLPGLRAAMVSASPDGLIAWCWTRDERAEIALGFAALDRAVTVCLEGLGAAQRSRTLLLTTEGVRIASWPIFRDDTPRSRLVLTAVFDGELQEGMVLVHGTRLRTRVAEAIESLDDVDFDELRRVLVDKLDAADSTALLGDIASDAGISLHLLSRLEDLSPNDHRRLLASARALG